jgi:uncharacterized protein
MESNSKRIKSYLILTFLITWGSWGIILSLQLFNLIQAGSLIYNVLFTIGGAGTALSIIILKFRWKEFTALRDILKYTFYSPRLAVALAIVILACFCRFSVVYLFSSRNVSVPFERLFAALPLAATFSGGFEELGWRGFLQPELERKIPLPLAALVTGLIWTGWHIPLFFMKGSSQSSMNFLFFLLFTVVTSFSLAIIFRTTKNVFACALFHGWANVTFAVFAIQPSMGMILSLSMEFLLSISIYITLIRRKQIAIP